MVTTTISQPDPRALAALDNLRAPILAFPCHQPAEDHLRSGMLQLAEQLENLFQDGEHDTLDAAIGWSALFSFPALVAPGPEPQKLVSLMMDGHLIDEETLATLQTLAKIRCLITAYKPSSFTGALWCTTLLAIYNMIEVFLVLDDNRGLDLCFELLDTAESIAGKIATAAKVREAGGGVG